MNTNGHNSTNGYSKGLKANKITHENKPEELFDFKWIYSILKRYIWFIIAGMMVGTALAYYLAFEYMLPVYQSNATLYISGSSNTFPGGGEISNIISSSYGLGGGSVKTEMQFLKSRELSLEVAKQIKNAKYLPNGEIYPLLWVSYPQDSTITSVEAVAGRVRRGLTVEPVEMGSNILGVSFESYSSYEAARVINFALNAYQELTAFKKRASARAALQFLEKEKARIKAKLKTAENQLSSFMSNEGVVQIDAQTSNLVNTVSSLQLQKQNILIQLKAVNAGIENYENQLDAIRPGLGKKYAQAVGPTISAYQTQLAELQMQRFLLVSNNPRLKKHPESEPKLRRIDEQIASLKQEIKRLTNQLLDGNKNYLGLLAETGGNVTQEISTIQNNLTQLHIKKNQYQVQLQAINSRLQNNRAFLDQVPQNKIQLARLKRKVKMYEQIYLRLANQANEVTLWKQTQSGAGTIIDYARVSDNPVKPRKIIWLGFGLLLGFAIPFGVLLGKETLSNRITSIQDMKYKTYPLLSVIYNHNSLDKKKQLQLSKTTVGKNKKISQQLITYHYGLSPIAEAYRNLVSKILYSQPDSTPKKILITSAGAGEGKTTLTANMGVALVEIGYRVLIIDCDMRKPGIPGFFGCSKAPGIMELLFKDKSMHKVIKKTPVKGLDLITSGKRKPAQPASILGSKAFKELIKKLELEYDFILFDSAPFGIIGDVAPLIQTIDGVVLTSKFAVTKIIELDHTIEKLENNSAKILGLVLNWYNPTKSLDDAEVKNLYNNLYNSYYNYQEKPNKKRVYL